MAIQDESTTSTAADVAELESEELDQTIEDAPEEEESPEPAREGADESESEEETEEGDAEPEEKTEEVFHPFARPSIKEINEAYPDLFKKFPSLRDMYFREAEYSKVFPTIEDAKDSQEKATYYDDIRSDVFEGNGSKLFNGIKEADPKALDRFSQTVLATLFQVNPSSFWRAANPLIEDVARNMFQKGVKEGNESLQNAARHLSDFFFGNVEIAEGKRTSVVAEKGEDSSVKQERDAWDQERYQEFRGKIENETRNELVKLISEVHPKTGKSRLDPDSNFSKFIRDSITEKILSELGSQLTADKDHIRFMDSLWDKAKKNGRTDSDKARIISAYLARAKSMIPTLRAKYVSEARGDGARRAEKVKDVTEKAISRVSSNSGRPSNGRRESYNPRDINYRKTSDDDILNDRITYKN